MTTEQAQRIIEILEFHFNWTALYASFVSGFVLGGGVMIYKFTRHMFDQTD